MHSNQWSVSKLAATLLTWALTVVAQPAQQVPNATPNINPNDIGAKGRVENLVVGPPVLNKPGGPRLFEIKTKWKVFVPQFLTLRSSDLFLTVTYADGSTVTEQVLVATCGAQAGNFVSCEGKPRVPAKLTPSVPLKSFTAKARAFYNPKLFNAENVQVERKFILTPANNFSEPGIISSASNQELVITGIVKTGQQLTHPNRFKVTWFVRAPQPLPFESFQVSIAGAFNFTGGNSPKTFSAGGAKQVTNPAQREVEIDINDSAFRNDTRQLTQVQATVTIQGRRDQTGRQPAEAQVSGNF